SSFAGGDLDQEVVRPLADAGVPFLESTETAMLALRHAREHRRFLDRTDLAHGSLTAPRSNLAAPRASAGFSGTLGNTEAMQLLRDFGIPLAETIAAKDAGAAVAAADRLGYPVVLKIDSPQIAHKTDVGGIRVGCGDAAAVRAAFAEMLDEVRRRAPAARGAAGPGARAGGGRAARPRPGGPPRGGPGRGRGAGRGRAPARRRGRGAGGAREGGGGRGGGERPTKTRRRKGATGGPRR